MFSGEEKALFSAETDHPERDYPTTKWGEQVKSMDGRDGKQFATEEPARATKETSKQRGELAEMMFMVKAAQEGFCVSKPYGDNQRYDFIVEAGQWLWRVQVKSTATEQYGAYPVNIHRHTNGRMQAYSASEIDFVVALVLPRECWYVIPVEAILPRTSLRVCVHGDERGGEFGKYWEAWGLMRYGPAAMRGMSVCLL